MCADMRTRFPPVLQAASLKPITVSAPACAALSFPPVLQAASLKPPVAADDVVRRVVFRLFCRRPH